MGVQADYKVIVTGELPLTPAKLQGALNDLHEAGAPDWAKLNVQRGSEWAVIATWDPKAAPAKPDVQVNIDGTAWDPEAAAKRIQAQVTRRIADNPQA